MSEELPGIPVTSAVGEKWIVVKNDCLATYTDGHLLRYVFEAFHEALSSLLHVVVSQDEVYLSV